MLVGRLHDGHRIFIGSPCLRYFRAHYCGHRRVNSRRPGQEHTRGSFPGVRALREAFSLDVACTPWAVVPAGLV